MFILNRRNGKKLARTRYKKPWQSTLHLCPNDCSDDESCDCKPKKKLHRIHKQFDYNESAPFQLQRHVTGLPIILKSTEGAQYIKQRSKELLEDSPNRFNQRDEALRVAAILTAIEKEYDIQRQTEWVSSIILEFLRETTGLNRG